MAILGAHMSIAGGHYKAVSAAEMATCDCVQIFTKNNNRWKAKPITDELAEKFRSTLDASSIEHPLSHASYLINLGSPDDELRTKSIDAFVIELQRAEQLGIPYVVLHPGAYTTSTEELGIQAIIASLDEVHSQTRGIGSKCLLENTAGQGSVLGWKFSQLAEMISGVQDPDRVGVCFDTCHAFAAGYALSAEADYEATFDEFEQTVGVEQIKAFHLNDSKKELGSRVDRHENIGQGCIGETAFANLLNDPRFKSVPMYIETPKGEDESGADLDVVNLELLRRLAHG